MPAAAVIPAPIAYIKVVAVKKLVVEFWPWVVWFGLHWSIPFPPRSLPSGLASCYFGGASEPELLL